jgi:hypothetical protein
VAIGDLYRWFIDPRRGRQHADARKSGFAEKSQPGTWSTRMPGDEI